MPAQCSHDEFPAPRVGVREETTQQDAPDSGGRAVPLQSLLTAEANYFSTAGPFDMYPRIRRGDKTSLTYVFTFQSSRRGAWSTCHFPALEPSAVASMVSSEACSTILGGLESAVEQWLK